MEDKISDGDKDSLVSAKTAFNASNAVKNGKIHIMKGCKHWAAKERPEEFVDTIKKFICGI